MNDQAKKRMNDAFAGSRPKFIRKVVGWSLLGTAALIVTALVFTPSYKIDRREAPPGAYKLLSEWVTNPVQSNGVDFTPLLPMIREAMEDDGHVYIGEWKRISRASEALEREHTKAMLRDALK